MNMKNKLVVATLLFAASAGTVCRAQEFGAEPPRWRDLGVSIAAHGAASGFDAWTSWQRIERNGLLSDGGRFAAGSAYRKAGMFAGVSLVQLIAVKKWGRKHPWIERACRVANFTSAGMFTAAGARNLSTR